MMLRELHMLSDILDSSGFRSEADKLDGVINVVAIQGGLKDTALDLLEGIRDIIENNPNISDDGKEELNNSINSFVEKTESLRDPYGKTKVVNKEDAIVLSLKSLYDELNDEESTESERYNEIMSMSKYMEEFRVLDFNRRKGDIEKAEYIRNELGQERINGIENLLSEQARKLGANEHVLPPIMLQALEYYNSLPNKRSIISGKVKENTIELEYIKQELAKIQWSSVNDFSADKEKLSEETQKLFYKKERAIQMMDFYSDKQKKMDTESSDAISSIKKLVAQMHLVIGANEETAKVFHEKLGDENIKLLTQIGNKK